MKVFYLIIGLLVITTLGSSYAIKSTNHIIYKNIKKTNHIKKHHILLYLKESSKSNDNKDINNLLVDINQLDESEQKRLAYLQKISLEADQMIKDAGFNIDNDIGDISYSIS